MAAHRLWDLGEEYNASSNHKRNSVIKVMWSPWKSFAELFNARLCATWSKNCMLLSVFCGVDEEEEQTLEECVVFLRDPMHMFVAEAERQGFVGDGRLSLF